MGDFFFSSDSQRFPHPPFPKSATVCSRFDSMATPPFPFPSVATDPPLFFSGGYYAGPLYSSPPAFPYAAPYPYPPPAPAYSSSPFQRPPPAPDPSFLPYSLVGAPASGSSPYYQASPTAAPPIPPAISVFSSTTTSSLHRILQHDAVPTYATRERPPKRSCHTLQLWPPRSPSSNQSPTPGASQSHTSSKISTRQPPVTSPPSPRRWASTLRERPVLLKQMEPVLTAAHAQENTSPASSVPSNTPSSSAPYTAGSPSVAISCLTSCVQQATEDMMPRPASALEQTDQAVCDHLGRKIVHNQNQVQQQEYCLQSIQGTVANLRKGTPPPPQQPAPAPACSSPACSSFYPQDCDLVMQYLLPKLAGSPLPAATKHYFHDADVYADDPETLTSLLPSGPPRKSGSSRNWYFFCAARPKIASDGRKHRIVGKGKGIWLAERGEPVVDPAEGYRVGRLDRFTYVPTPKEEGKPPEWLMAEFRLNQELVGGGKPTTVLCRIYRSRRFLKSKSLRNAVAMDGAGMALPPESANTLPVTNGSGGISKPPMDEAGMAAPPESANTLPATTSGGGGIRIENYFFKSRLLEYASKAGLMVPKYQTLLEDLSYEPTFKSTVLINNAKYESLPGFLSRKAAEQSAAEVALMEISKSAALLANTSIPAVETGMCKTLLQLYAQKMNYGIPSYIFNIPASKVSEVAWICTVEIGGIQYIGAAARTKKEAAIKAARTALLAIQGQSEGCANGTTNYIVVPGKRQVNETEIKPVKTPKSLKAKKGGYKKRRNKMRFIKKNGEAVNVEKDDAILPGDTQHFDVSMEPAVTTQDPSMDTVMLQPDEGAGRMEHEPTSDTPILQPDGEATKVEQESPTDTAMLQAHEEARRVQQEPPSDTPMVLHNEEARSVNQEPFNDTAMLQAQEEARRVEQEPPSDTPMVLHSEEARSVKQEPFDAMLQAHEEARSVNQESPTDTAMLQAHEEARILQQEPPSDTPMVLHNEEARSVNQEPFNDTAMLQAHEEARRGEHVPPSDTLMVLHNEEARSVKQEPFDDTSMLQAHEEARIVQEEPPSDILMVLHNEEARSVKQEPFDDTAMPQPHTEDSSAEPEPPRDAAVVQPNEEPRSLNEEPPIDTVVLLPKEVAKTSVIHAFPSDSTIEQPNVEGRSIKEEPLSISCIFLDLDRAREEFFEYTAIMQHDEEP